MAWYNFFSKKLNKQSERSIAINDRMYNSYTQDESSYSLSLSDISIGTPVDTDLLERLNYTSALVDPGALFLSETIDVFPQEELEDEEDQENEDQENEEERIERDLDATIEELEYTSGESSAALIKYMYKQIEKIKAKQIESENQIHSLEEQLASIEFYKE